MKILAHRAKAWFPANEKRNIFPIEIYIFSSYTRITVPCWPYSSSLEEPNDQPWSRWCHSCRLLGRHSGIPYCWGESMKFHCRWILSRSSGAEERRAKEESAPFCFFLDFCFQHSLPLCSGRVSAIVFPTFIDDFRFFNIFLENSHQHPAESLQHIFCWQIRFESIAAWPLKLSANSILILIWIITLLILQGARIGR